MDFWRHEGDIRVDLGEGRLGGERIGEIGRWGEEVLAIQVGTCGSRFGVECYFFLVLRSKCNHLVGRMGKERFFL